MVTGLGLILTSFNDIVLPHFAVNFTFQFFEINDLLVAILVECGTVFFLDEAMHLKLLVDDCFDLLHCLQDKVPRLDVKNVT